MNKSVIHLERAKALLENSVVEFDHFSDNIKRYYAKGEIEGVGLLLELDHSFTREDLIEAHKELSSDFIYYVGGNDYREECEGHFKEVKFELVKAISCFDEEQSPEFMLINSDNSVEVISIERAIELHEDCLQWELGDSGINQRGEILVRVKDETPYVDNKKIFLQRVQDCFEVEEKLREKKLPNERFVLNFQKGLIQLIEITLADEPFEVLDQIVELKVDEGKIEIPHYLEKDFIRAFVDSEMHLGDFNPKDWSGLEECYISLTEPNMRFIQELLKIC